MGGSVGTLEVVAGGVLKDVLVLSVLCLRFAGGLCPRGGEVVWPITRVYVVDTIRGGFTRDGTVGRVGAYAVTAKASREDMVLPCTTPGVVTGKGSVELLVGD